MTGPGDTLVALVHAVDRLDWDGVRAAFADRLALDYTSLSGGEPEDLAADELIDRWRSLLPGFEATQHLLGPVLSSDTGDNSQAEAHVRAWHRIGDREWMVAGHYVAELTRDGDERRITALRLDTYYQEGDLDLPATATQRASTEPRQPTSTA
jgi:hypothetical protein